MATKTSSSPAGAGGAADSSSSSSSGGGASVVGKALRGSSYLFLQKLLTFALNSLVLRKLQLSITGAVTVRLELVLASVFFLRDGFRLAFLRMPSLDIVDSSSNNSSSNNSSSNSNGSDSDTTDARTRDAAHRRSLVQQLVNVAWLSTAISWAVAIVIIAGARTRFASDPKDTSGLEHYTLVLTMYCAAAMIEAVAEPMYVLAHCSVLVSWQVAAQSAGFVVRALVQYVCIFALDLELVAYGIAELAYALTLASVFAAFFWRRIHHSPTSSSFALSSMRELLPGRPSLVVPSDRPSVSARTATKGPTLWFHTELLALLVPLSLQSGVKYLLTEGDKWVLTLVASLEHMGVYGIVFHLGSLVPRIVFLPIEEATKTIFSKMSTAAAASDGQHIVRVLLQFMNLVGLVFVCFGATHASTLVLLLYGAAKAEHGVGSALALYCVYIALLGLNGVCEAVVHAVGTAQQLMRLNSYMLAFFSVYATSAVVFMGVLDLGTGGIILANGVNMLCRIVYCLAFLATHFRGKTATGDGASDAAPTLWTNARRLWAFWRATLPSRTVLVAFGAALCVTATSSVALLGGGGSRSAHVAWRYHALHVGIGAVCFAAVAVVLYVKERAALREQLQMLRSSGRRPQQQDETGAGASKPKAD